MARPDFEYVETCEFVLLLFPGTLVPSTEFLPVDSVPKELLPPLFAALVGETDAVAVDLVDAHSPMILKC